MDYTIPTPPGYDYSTKVHVIVIVFQFLIILLCLLNKCRSGQDRGPKIESHDIEKLMPPVISNKNHETTSKHGGCPGCVICLEEFKVGERCRVFPKCNHDFHVACIDNWLKLQNFTCPICRNSLALPLALPLGEGKGIE